MASAQARVSLASPTVHAFSDTTSVRIEVEIPTTKIPDGTVLSARIVGAAGDEVVWTGEIGKLAVGADGIGRLTKTLSGLHPHLWSPQSPMLYSLLVRPAGATGDVIGRIRFGFRSVGMKDGRILLNGRPIFLRGNAINPPERNIPDSLEEDRRFVEDYVRYLKSVNVNIIRLTRHSQVWFDVCDELGMMLFQGNYGTPQGGKATQAPAAPLSESVNWYRKDVIGPLVNHPSVVIYVLSNEQADSEINYLTTGAVGVNKFLGAMYDSLHTWDSTRLYIANAGYGFGRVGEICDLHRYWGWYYNSFLSFYTMRDPKICWRSGVEQPMTMTENVGNYTGVDGRFNLVPNTKQPDSQLNWTGHAPQSEQAEQALTYQAWMAKQAIEIFRRSREQNPNLAGLTPFTIVFHNWWGISRFADMKPKPIAKQYGVSYQPILLSWESWTPNAYAGATINPVAHVVNDSDDGSDLSNLTLNYYLVGADGHMYFRGDTLLPDVPYYSARSKVIPIALPVDLPQGVVKLTGTITRGLEVISTNDVSIFVAKKSFGSSTQPIAKNVLLYDDSTGKTAKALKTVGIGSTPLKSLSNLSTGDLVVIGAEAWNKKMTHNERGLRAFVERGGKVLVLHQNPANFDVSWLPVSIKLQTGQLDHPLVFPGGRPFMNGMSVNPEQLMSPVFDGVSRDRFFLWSDFTNWNESKPGFPQVYPVTRGFVIPDAKAMGQVAVLANYDHGLQGIALAELFGGRGSVLVTGLDVVNRAGLDPVSDRMLVNMVRYMSTGAHDAAPMIDSKIVWGDYASERGLLTGIYSGMILNTVPVVPADLATKYPITVDSVGYTFAGGTSGWNTKPAIQYVPRGRRAFGPYTFSSGGSVELIDRKSTLGEGQFWVRVPSSRTSMSTTISNPVSQSLQMEITVNGVSSQETVPGKSVVTVNTPLTRANKTVGVSFKGDRRLVLLETDFK